MTGKKDIPSELHQVHAHEAHDAQKAHIDAPLGRVPERRVSLILIIEIVVLVGGLIWYLVSHPHFAPLWK